MSRGAALPRPAAAGSAPPAAAEEAPPHRTAGAPACSQENGACQHRRAGSGAGGPSPAADPAGWLPAARGQGPDRSRVCRSTTSCSSPPGQSSTKCSAPGPHASPHAPQGDGSCWSPEAAGQPRACPQLGTLSSTGDTPSRPEASGDQRGPRRAAAQNWHCPSCPGPLLLLSQAADRPLRRQGPAQACCAVARTAPGHVGSGVKAELPLWHGSGSPP